MGSSEKASSGSLLGNLLLLAVSSILALGVAEFAFRAFETIQWHRAVKYHQNELFRMLPDDPREYGLHPVGSRENLVPDSGLKWSYSINSEGFRGREFSIDPGRKRILFVGDSYTFGWGVEEDETLPRAVEQVLSKPPFQLEVDAWNLGVPGYNTQQEFHLLNQLLDRASPHLVVLGFVMNDAQPQFTVPERPSVRYQRVKSWLLAFIKNQINLTLYDGEPILRTGLNVHDADFLAALERDHWKWAATQQAFADIVALSRSRDIPFLLVIFPSYNMSFSDRYPFKQIHKNVAEWAVIEGVESVDLLGYMMGEDNKAYRVEGDGHPNARAFAKAASVLAPFIAESLGAGSVRVTKD